MSKPNIIQLSEFDITQKIIESLSNVCTRSVLFSIKNESKDATQIADELKISLSTVYKTLCNSRRSCTCRGRQVCNFIRRQKNQIVS